MARSLELVHNSYYNVGAWQSAISVSPNSLQSFGLRLKIPFARPFDSVSRCRSSSRAPSPAGIQGPAILCSPIAEREGSRSLPSHFKGAQPSPINTLQPSRQRAASLLRSPGSARRNTKPSRQSRYTKKLKPPSGSKFSRHLREPEAAELCVCVVCFVCACSFEVSGLSLIEEVASLPGMSSPRTTYNYTTVVILAAGTCRPQATVTEVLPARFIHKRTQTMLSPFNMGVSEHSDFALRGRILILQSPAEFKQNSRPRFQCRGLARLRVRQMSLGRVVCHTTHGPWVMASHD